MSVLGVSQAAAQSQVRYSTSFANRAHHEAEITVSFTNLDDRPLQLRMSRSSPGRYALHEFAKNVYNFRASGLDGRAVTVSHPTITRSPLYQAGFDRGDRVLDIGGASIVSAGELRSFLQDHALGEAMTVRFESRGQTYETSMTLASDRTLAGALETGAGSTESQRDFLRRWKAGSED